MVAEPSREERRFNAFTERARRVLVFAQEESSSLQGNFIGPDHLLLGLLREEGGVAFVVLVNFGVDLTKTYNQLKERVQADKTEHFEIGLTDSAKKIVDFAVEESLRLDHYYVGTEHLLLGYLHQNTGLGANILFQQGVELEKVREEIKRLLGKVDP